MLSFFLTCIVIVIGLGSCYVLVLLGMLAIAGLYHAAHEVSRSIGRGAMLPLVLLHRATALPVEYVIPAVLGLTPFVLLAWALLR